ncbi:MAG: hypothetical protein HOP13_11075 [Alphaproteobacteria bacterium]|nr:hypothetical protein [Alphaproteobacteria bacterium]
MTFDKLFGPATIVYLVSASVAALWWASALTTRVQTIERSTVTAERIARLESEVANLTESTKDLKHGIGDLVHELRQPKR